MLAPLHHDDQCQTTDIAEAREFVSRILSPHELAVERHDEVLKARMRSHRMQNVAINDLSYGAEVRIVPGFLKSFFVTQIPISGNSVIRCGKQEILCETGRASVPNPDQWLSMRWTADCTQRVVRFEHAVLVAHLADMLGYPPHQGSLQFDLDLDVRTGHGHAFVEEVDMVAHRLDQLPGLYSSEYAVRVQEEALMTRLLLAAGHNYREALASESLPVPSRVVRIAVDVMHSDTDRLHTLASLARAASVSTRTLEREFRTQLHTTPMAYYRTVRIDRARHKLHAADPDLTTVADIARQEGFLNRGRFAAEYRRRYGESPSKALGR